MYNIKKRENVDNLTIIINIPENNAKYRAKKMQKYQFLSTNSKEQTWGKCGYFNQKN